MAFSVQVESSEVEGERRVILREDGVHRGTKFARSLDQAITKVEADLRGLQRCGIPMREEDIKNVLEQVRERWL